VAVALVYCLFVEVLLLASKDRIGSLFVADPEVIAAAGKILPFYAALYLTLGPMMMIARYL
jgi:Na+-driven multidrug efflux pump